MNRTQLMLGGLLLVQVVLILIFHSPFSGATSGVESRPLLPVLAAVTPSQLEIRGSDDDVLTLVRQGGEWRVDNLGGFPADGQKVDDLLEDLKQLTVRRPVVSSGRYHAAFKVSGDEYEARVLLWDEPADDPQVDLIVGSSPNFRSSHVRLAGEDAVYEVRGLSPYDLRPDSANWIDKNFVDTDEARVIGLTLTNESGSFELEKQEGVWKVLSPATAAGQELDADKADALIRALSSIRLSGGAGPVDEASHGLAQPAATLVLRLGPDDAEESAETELIVKVGGQVEDNESQRYVTRDGFGFTGTVWESSVRQLLEKTLDELYGS